jgi:hypothetical protein
MVNKLPDNIDNPIDVLIFKIIDPQLEMYHAFGFTPNMITTLSLLTGLYASYLVTQKKYIEASISLVFSYYFDCVDGKMARKYNMVTKFGDYYDHISDLTKILLLLFVLYKDDSNKFKKILLIIIPLTFLSSYHIGCQQTLYPEESQESPTLDIFKSNPESCNKHVNKTKYFGFGTFYIAFALIIMFWHKIK